MKFHIIVLAALWQILTIATALAQAQNLTIPAPNLESRESLEQFLSRSLAALPESKGDIKPPLPAELAQVIAAHQPQAGDFLLKLSSDAQNPLNRPAVAVFASNVRLMSAPQITAYLRDALVLEAHLRPHYPESFASGGSFEYHIRHRWFGWPGDNFKLKTQVSHFLDGQPYGDKYAGSGPMSTTGWLKTQDLALGTHSAASQMKFSWEIDALRGEGQVDSAPFTFEIVDSALPDGLENINTPAAQKSVAEAFKVQDVVNEGEAMTRGQQTSTSQGKTYALRSPGYDLENPLPFALMFTVEVHDLKNDRVFEGESISIPANSRRFYGGYLGLRNIQSFAVGRELTPGEEKIVPVRIVLQPSYEMALHNPEISAFFGGALTFDNLNMIISQAAH